MPTKVSPKPKTGKSRKAHIKKGKSRSSFKMLIILFALFCLIVLAELVSYFKNQNDTSKLLTVQALSVLNGDSIPSGSFKAWDVVPYLGGIALSDQTRILRLDLQGKDLGQIDQKQAGPPDFEELSCLTTDSSGNLYVIEPWHGLIRGFDAKGNLIAKISLSGKGFYGPRGIVWDNGFFIVADTGSHRLVKVAEDGSVAAAWGQQGSGKGNFNSPYQVTTDGQGRYYVVDRDNNRIQILDSTGHFVSSINLGVKPTAEAIDRQRKLIYVSSTDGKFVRAYTLKGDLIGNLVTAGQQPQPIQNVNALGVLENGDVVAVQLTQVTILHPLPNVNPKS